MAAERDLLFGLLALQNGLIDQGQLVAAFQAWIRDRSRPLADFLMTRGNLDADDRAAVDALVSRHLKRHGDAAKSLAFVPIGQSTRERLAHLGDPEIEASLGHVRADRDAVEQGVVERTITYAVSTADEDGRRFRVLRPHSRGGLGAVFVALDEELHREVALKRILDEHADDPVSRARFMLEAEVTGGLEHPGIVPVYGLGHYADGRPYYAMRFIRGDSLKAAIDRFHNDETLKHDPGRRSLGLRQLLRRFVDVCNAIDYAHSRGVLHRDIKPGNIIVGKHGETLVVDWGLAKASGHAEPGADERTLHPTASSGSGVTLPGSTLGTPAYMSPEQARGDLNALGPRSDVYSLGATLYCLLTGAPPFEGDAVDVLAQCARGEFRPPRAVDPAIDTALEAVCLKAMAAQPDGRYGSCRALAEDVERWMADEPVSALHEPLARKTRRWAKRNRTAVTASVVALVAAVIGLSALAAEQVQSNIALKKAHGTTKLALENTALARDQAKVALAKSEESRKQADAVRKFIVEALSKPDPFLDGKDVKVADVLDQAAEQLQNGFDGSKETEAAFLMSLTKAYFGLGLYPKADATSRKALAIMQKTLGPTYRDTLGAASQQGLILLGLSRIREGATLLEETLRKQRETLGADDEDLVTTRCCLANAYISSGRAREAVDIMTDVISVCEAKLGPDHPDTLQWRILLANAYLGAGRTAEAVALQETNLDALKAKLGADHPNVLNSRISLAQAYRNAGRRADAIKMHEANLAVLMNLAGPQHPATIRERWELAENYRLTGAVARAIPVLEETVRQAKDVLGPQDARTVEAQFSLVLACEAVRAAGRFGANFA